MSGRLQKHPDQFRLFGQKGIVTVSAGHLAVLGVNPGGANCLGEFPDRIWRKQPVGADSHKNQAGANAAEGFPRRSTAIQRVPGVHGAQNGQVGIGVEAVDEPLSLVIEVAGDIETPANQAATLVVEAPRVLAIPVGIAGEALVEQRRQTCS